jgi:hypothetical protein
MSAVAQAAFGNTVFQSAKAKLVVSTIGRLSYRRLTIWKEQIGRAVVVGQVADLVDAKHLGPGVVREPALERTGGVLLVQVQKQIGRRDEERALAGEHRAVREVLGDHRLAHALRRHEHDVLGTLEEAERHHALDRRSVDLLGPTPVEVRHRLETPEFRAR